MNIRRQLQQQAERVRNRPAKPRYRKLDDLALVDLARGGDKAAFGELYERYIDKIYHYVYYRTGSTQDAEDLTARVFHRAMGHIETYTDRGVPFQAWLYRIAHNLVANWHRDRGRRRIIPLDEFIASNLGSDAPERHAEDQEEREALLAAIRRLPEERQQLLIYKFVDHLSNAEIGQAMDRTEGAIKSLYHRTLLSLRESLRDYRPAGSDEPLADEAEGR
jgi:RNA polymerase sigma-70 factor (ECF subfamily)